MALLATPASAHDRDRDFDLPQAGVYIEGIGVDEHAGVFYVSATNQSGTIYRGRLCARERKLEVWQPPTAGNDGRGIEVDRAGRVFVAGGPAAEVRVFDRRGALLAELPTGAAGSYLNDVWIGPDGAAYVTDSSLPVIWRVSNRYGHWRIDRFLDVSGTIAYTPPLTDFDLGGITSTPTAATCSPRRERPASCGGSTSGRAGSARSTSAARASSTPTGSCCAATRSTWCRTSRARSPSCGSAGASSAARVVNVLPTPADRTFTTAKPVGRTLLAVDSKFGFPATAAVAEDRIVAIDTF